MASFEDCIIFSLRWYFFKINAPFKAGTKNKKATKENHPKYREGTFKWAK